MENARTSDRSALLPGRNPGASFRKSAIRRRARNGLQPIGAPDFCGWGSEYGCAGLRLHRQDQPVLKNPAEASALLDQLHEVAGKYNIEVENPAIGTGETTPYHQTVFASIETKSPWPPLVHFLYDVQHPEAFVVFENVNLAIDGNDPTMMRGKFKIARWFASGQKGSK